MTSFRRPLEVNSDRAWRTYMGGRELDRLEGKENPQDSYFPEEWVLSTTRAQNIGREDMMEGICFLKDHTPKVSLKEIIESAPQFMLGDRHIRKYGNVPGVLIKLIDSSVRLNMQVHPDKRSAKELFHSGFGKTECWHIVGVRKDMEQAACVYLGFQPGVTREEWEKAFHDQDTAKMLSMLNRYEVKTGETYLVPGGVPHAIGAGCLLFEIQEPTDITIRMERKTSYGLVLDDTSLHSGLGFEKMFDCFPYEGMTYEDTLAKLGLAKRLAEEESMNGSAVFNLVDYSDTDCFKMQKVNVHDRIRLKNNGDFSGIYVWKGKGSLIQGDVSIPIERRSQIFIPAGIDDFEVVHTGGEELVLFRFYGPQA